MKKNSIKKIILGVVVILPAFAVLFDSKIKTELQLINAASGNALLYSIIATIAVYIAISVYRAIYATEVFKPLFPKLLMNFTIDLAQTLTYLLLGITIAHFLKLQNLNTYFGIFIALVLITKSIVTAIFEAEAFRKKLQNTTDVHLQEADTKTILERTIVLVTLLLVFVAIAVGVTPLRNPAILAGALTAVEIAYALLGQRILFS